MFSSLEYGVKTDTFFIHRDLSPGTFGLERGDSVISAGAIYDINHDSDQCVLHKEGEVLHWDRERGSGSNFLSASVLEVGDVLTIEYRECALPDSSGLSPPLDDYLRRVYWSYYHKAYPHFGFLSKEKKDQVIQKHEFMKEFCFDEIL